MSTSESTKDETTTVSSGDEEKKGLISQKSIIEDEKEEELPPGEIPSYPTCRMPLQVLGVQPRSPVAWSASGEYLAFVSMNFSIYVVKKVETRLQQGIKLSFHRLWTLSGHANRVHFLLFHPTLPILVSTSHDGIFIWDITRGVLIQKITPATSRDAHDGDVYCASWVCGSRGLVTVSQDATIRAWDFREAKAVLIDNIPAHKSGIMTCAYHEETGVLATGGRDSIVKTWEISALSKFLESPGGKSKRGGVTIAQLSSMEGHRGDITSLTFSKDGKQLWSSACDNSSKLWDLTTQTDVREITENKGNVIKVLLEKEGKTVITASIDSFIKVWEAPESVDQILQNEVRESSDMGNLLGKEIENEELRALLSNDSSVKNLLRKDFGAKMMLTKTFMAHEEGIFNLEACPTAPIYATSSLGTSIRIWANNGTWDLRLIHEYVGHKAAITDTYLLQEDIDNDESNILYTASNDFYFHEYDLESLGRRSKINFGTSISGFCVAPDRKLIIVGGTNYDIRGYAMSGEVIDQSLENHKNYVGCEVVRFSGHSGQIRYLEMHPGGQMFVSCANDFQMLTWKVKGPFKPRVLSFGQLQTETTFDTARSDIQSLKIPWEQSKYLIPQVLKFSNSYNKAHEGRINELEFSENGDYLLSCGNDHKIIVWGVNAERASLSKKASFSEAHGHVISGACWCGMNRNDEPIFATCSWDKTVKIWALTNKGKKITLIKTLMGHLEKVTDIGVGASKDFLFSCSDDCTIRCYSLVAPYKCVAVYVTEESTPFTSLSIGRNQFVSGSGSGMVGLWPFPVEKYKTCFVGEKGEYEKKTEIKKQFESRKSVTSTNRN